MSNRDSDSEKNDNNKLKPLKINQRCGSSDAALIKMQKYKDFRITSRDVSQKQTIDEYDSKFNSIKPLNPY